MAERSLTPIQDVSCRLGLNLPDGLILLDDV